MPSLRFNTTIAAAGGTVANLLTGSKFEYLPSPATVLVYAVAGVAGVDMECFAGNTAETDQLEIPLQSVAGAGPSTLDDRVSTFTAAAGDRLTVRLFNRAGGVNAVIRTLIEIRPL